MRELIIEALIAHAMGHIEKHKANVEVLLQKAVGIGEHGDVLSEIEKELKKTPNFYGVSSLNDQKDKGVQIKLIQSFLSELEKVYDELNKNQIKNTITEWTKRSSTIGKKVEMHTVNGTISGKAIKIDEDGGLIIKVKEKTNKVFAGDIIHLSK